MNKMTSRVIIYISHLKTHYFIWRCSVKADIIGHHLNSRVFCVRGFFCCNSSFSWCSCCWWCIAPFSLPALERILICFIYILRLCLHSLNRIFVVYKKGTSVASLNHFVYLARASVLKCIGRSASLHIWCRSRLCQYCLSLFKRNMVHRIGKIHVTKLEKYRSSVLKCKEHGANVYIWCHSQPC